MKKTIKMLAILAMSVSLVACGNKEEAEEMSIESTESISSEVIGTELTSSEIASTEVTSIEAASTETTEESTTFEDNFAVDSKTAADFGLKIKEAVAAKDIEKLAQLVSYPTYVGFDEGLVVETKEDFIAIDKEKLFTAEMVKSIAGADEKTLTASKAGFTLQTEGSSPSITYSVVDGKLGIVGINY